MRYWNCYRCERQIPFDGKIKVIDGQVYHPNCPAKRPADLSEAGASAERITSVVRSNATTGWISVMDSEPDSLDEVLTYSKNAGLGISFFSNGSWYDYGTTEWIDVTHWMPLPEAPEV